MNKYIKQAFCDIAFITFLYYRLQPSIIESIHLFFNTK